ncbi:MAG: GNAT family N-acetyltransferase [Nitrososphaerales archaeon]
MICLKPTIRPATDADSERIQELLKANGLWVDGLDWTHLQNWYVAEHKDRTVGAVQILPGRPVGCLMYITVDSEYIGSGVGFILWQFSKALLAAQGSDCVFAFTNNDWILNAADRLGLTILDSFTLTAKRLPKIDRGTYVLQ